VFSNGSRAFQEVVAAHGPMAHLLACFGCCRSSTYCRYFVIGALRADASGGGVVAIFFSLLGEIHTQPRSRVKEQEQLAQ